MSRKITFHHFKQLWSTGRGGGGGGEREGGKSYLCDIHICAGRVCGQQPLLEVMKHNEVRMDWISQIRTNLCQFVDDFVQVDVVDSSNLSSDGVN